MKNKQLEKEECKIFATWLRLKNIKFAHIANERQAPVWVMAELNKMGVSKGFPDYIVYINKKQSIENRALLLFIEMKKNKEVLKNGKLSTVDLASPEQHDWIECLGCVCDVEAHICYGSDKAIEIINSLLK